MAHSHSIELEDLIRSELFSPERFDEHARSLAWAQPVTEDPSHGVRIFPLLRKSAKILRETYRYISTALLDNEAITPAAEWLVDSFYVVDEQLRDIQRGLPKKYYDELPKLADGSLKGYPRVYGICWAYVAHTDSRFDPELLVRFVRSYQEVQPLTIGELWAFSVTLRIVMIENLRRIAIRIVASQEARSRADAIADEFLGLIPETKKGPVISLDEFNRLTDGRSFLVQLVQRLRYQDPISTPALAWLNEQLTRENTDSDEIAAIVHQSMAAMNATVRNLITSFRQMSSYPWQDFFEETSLVHEVLASNPGFDEMDFNTRDMYRHAVEDIARTGGKSELEIARAATAKGDAGYHLIGTGRMKFEREQGLRYPVKTLWIRWYLHQARFAYFTSLFLATLYVLALPLSFYAPSGTLSLFILAALGLFPASDVACSVVNRLVTEVFGPKRLPRLELLEGPPMTARTFVVVPTLLGEVHEIAAQFEKLEVHYLANPEGDTTFALLTDWHDSDVEYDLQKDGRSLEVARRHVDTLNEKHGLCSDGTSRFYLFHRKRLWNPEESKWMGWERKRGKLHEFNRLLREDKTTSYLDTDLEKNRPPRDIKFVITLDSDTRLPKGAVAQLVGIMCHPLNRPKFDPTSRKVVEGYGILQPRITASLPGPGERSIFQKLFSGECGVDPYASAVSDVYQDLFSEGSYTGKGIYDIDAYEKSMQGRIPENALLSHDLFEGSYARSGFASDVEFFEDFPSHQAVSDARNHRWIRGDWQLLPWIFGRSGADLPLVSRWKMLDNLRRSFSMPATLFLICLACSLPGVIPGPWIALGLAGFGIPPFIPFLADCFPRRNRTIRDHFHELKRTLRLAMGHFVVNLILLSHLAVHHLDAILRVLWRLIVSRKNLLEWTTAAKAKASASYRLKDFFARMWISVLIGGVVALLVAKFRPEALLSVLPFSVLWAGAPFFALWISLPAKDDGPPTLNVSDTAELRLHARRIWRFFTTFVTSEDHYLPPDNLQEDPLPIVAHRSSPTNFGLYLLSVVTAHDFGWCGLREMSTRLDQTLRSMKELPRFRGHFYNWYDTRSLQLLEPRYISSVDSGNLAGHLLVIAQACQESRKKSVFSTSAILGIKDALTLLRQEIEHLGEDRRTSLVTLTNLREAAEKLEGRLNRPQTSPAERAEYWDALDLRADMLRDIAEAFANERDSPETGEITAWAKLIAENVRSHADDFRTLLPWAQFLSRIELVEKGDAADTIHFEAINRILSLDLVLEQVPSRCEAIIPHIEALRNNSSIKRSSVDELYFDSLLEALHRSIHSCDEILKKFGAMSQMAHAFFEEMEFGFLYNKKKKLFSIGYRVGDEQLDESCYDLLASEARLTSYVAIIKGDVLVSHWFSLGRGLAAIEGGAALISWSGSMFEYLMPSLVMMNPTDSLLDRTCKLVVEKQIDYGKIRGVPWGVSESAFNVRDLALTYQYSNFGVPGLGLKRGLAEDLVVAPYATALASMVNPTAALANLRRIEELGGRGPYGFYEAMDFTPSRLRENQDSAIVRAYMAHHQGMTLISFANVALAGQPRKLFHREPLVQAAELLLQERTPRELGDIRHRLGYQETTVVRNVVEPVSRKLHSPHHILPTSHLLSNGRYAVMLTASGSGYSRWKGFAVTRWRNDITQDNWGNYLYLRDVKKNQIWSPTFHPAGIDPDKSKIMFTEQEAKILRVDGTLSTELRIIVSVEDDAELRQLTITNNGTEDRELEVTSYVEVVLAPHEADLAHPAFSNLFVQTEYIPEISGLLASRRPRSARESPIFMGQVITSNAINLGDIEYETDRARFIGRGRTLRRPVSVVDGRPLSNRAGAILDPILSLRRRIRIPPGTSAQLCFTTLVANSREDVIKRAEKYQNPTAFERASTLVWTHAHAKLRHLGIEPDEAHIFQKLANRIIFSDPLMRPSSETLKRNVLNITGLWGRGISGDHPIILVRVDDAEEQPLIRQLLRAHEYWRMKHLSVDIVIINEKATSYVQDFQLTLEALSRGSEATLPPNPDFYPGKIFVLRNDLLDPRERKLLQTVARAILNGRQGTLAEQVLRVRKPDPLKILPLKLLSEMPTTERAQHYPDTLKIPADLELFNGLGGFAPGGQEYVIILRKDQRTPAPWINVIANSQFGFQTSETGSGYTWSVNSRENQLTSWSNDPVVDPPSEVFYVRDLDSGDVWSPTTAPIRRDDGTYIIRHGHGYSSFQHESFGVETQLLQYLGGEDSVKISRLQLTNHTNRARKLSITGYVEWVLGFNRAATAPQVITEQDLETKALFATNPLNVEFGRRVAFLDMEGKHASFTGDRGEFIGRNGSLEKPGALFRMEAFSGSTGGAMDPCAAIQVEIVIAPGATEEVVCFLGQAETREAARTLITRYRSADLNVVLNETKKKWDGLLGKIQVRTPERAMDFILNGWLEYQTLACRFWARAAFYQASGAIGFRDQLQDSMAFIVAAPELAREHILKAASRQFSEGDVQHWWHPPTGRGVRTHFSDDLLWLPYVLLHYLKVTEDHSILDAEVPFIDGPLLRADQEDAYFEPRTAPAEGNANLFEHCARTLDRSLSVGSHGLPLIGSGDWNDGMNRVGHGGKGESVWVAWFLQSVLPGMITLAEKRGMNERADKWREHSKKLKTAIETEAWDGEWYRRAYFDDGTPLGSAKNDECKIDSIAQTWAILSASGDPARSVQAMGSVEKHLIKSEPGIILLFTPPFDKTENDPGYIKGYVPGVRENGGQYTHAAVWCVCAYAEMGNGTRATELFSMINPVSKASTHFGAQIYKVEPYVIAADIYGVAPHVGRGGWTWYTGSAGWMYRAGVEYILGIHKRGERLTLNPCIPEKWAGFSVSYRHGETRYEIQIDNPTHVSRGIVKIFIDDKESSVSDGIPLIHTGKIHQVRITMG